MYNNNIPKNRIVDWNQMINKNVQQLKPSGIRAFF